MKEKFLTPLLLIAVLGFSIATLVSVNRQVAVVDSETQVAQLVRNPSLVASRRCSWLSGPWIQIISPSGGETFSVGDTITVEYKTCKIPSPTNGTFGLTILNENYTSPGLEWDSIIQNVPLPTAGNNTETRTIQIQNTNSQGVAFPAQPGQQTYQARLVYKASNAYIEDYSSGSFTINAGSQPSLTSCVEVNKVPLTGTGQGVNPFETVWVNNHDNADIAKFSIENNCGEDITLQEMEFEVLGTLNVPHFKEIEIRDSSSSTFLDSAPSVQTFTTTYNNINFMRFEVIHLDYMISDGDIQEITLSAEIDHGGVPYQWTDVASFVVGIGEMEYIGNTTGNDYYDEKGPWADVIRAES